jgi:DNA gyrase subunit A
VDFRAQKRGGKGLSGGALKEDDVVTSLFVANTHTPLLFFTTSGMVYKLKTWRLPVGSRASRGKAIVNILPIEPGTGIAAVMPVDRDEDHWDELQVVFATDRGTVRRNALSDFANVMRNGKIAMKFEGESEGWRMINARIASNQDDVMLVTKLGRAIRFPATDVRVFNSRASTGVRGIKLAAGDEVVSMSIIRHFKAEAEERAAYLKQRRLMAGAPEEEVDTDEEDAVAEGQLSPDRYAEMSAAEDLILTITTAGSGKLSSSHDYPVRGRGGQGVIAMDKAMRGGPLVACFPVEMEDQIMLATSTGQSIRVPVEGISFRSRSAGGGSSTPARMRSWSRSPGSPIRHRARRRGRLGRPGIARSGRGSPRTRRSGCGTAPEPSRRHRSPPGG